MFDLERTGKVVRSHTALADAIAAARLAGAVSPLARRVAKLEQRRANSVADAHAMCALGRDCYLEGRALPDGLSPAERQIAAAVVDQLEKFFRVGEGTLPLEALPRG